jgi:hypothetical protein
MMCTGTVLPFVLHKVIEMFQFVLCIFLLQIAARPGSHNLRCLFRVAFVPRDACELAQRDLVAFEYLYMQVRRDIVAFSTVTLV